MEAQIERLLQDISIICVSSVISISIIIISALHTGGRSRGGHSQSDVFVVFWLQEVNSNLADSNIQPHHA